MLLNQDCGVNGEPIAEQNQQCVQPALEVVHTNDREHDVDDCSDDADEGPGNGLKPGMKSLRGEGEGVHVRNVIRDDPESEDDKAELTEATGRFESCTEESTDGILGIAFCKPRR